MINKAGTGYLDGDLLYIIGPPGNNDATFTVTQVIDPGQFLKNEVIHSSGPGSPPNLASGLSMLGNLTSSLTSALNFKNIMSNVFPFELPPIQALSDYYTLARGSSGQPDQNLPSNKAVADRATGDPNVPPTESKIPAENPVPSQAHAESSSKPYVLMIKPTAASQLLIPSPPNAASIKSFALTPEPSHSTGSPAQSNPSAAEKQSPNSPKLHASGSSHGVGQSAPIFPRETVALYGNLEKSRMISRKTQTDWTKPMQKYINVRINSLTREDLCGFIFKSKSPSCGLSRVPVYSEFGSHNARHGAGMFAKEFTNKFPLIPTEDEGRLNDPRIRENFIVKVFSFYRLQNLFKKNFSIGGLVKFHTQQKYLLLAHSRKHYDVLGQLVSKPKSLKM